MGPSWGYLGLCWPILGLCWRILRGIWAHLRAMLAHLGAMLAHLGPILGLSWPILGLCWPILRPMLAHVDPSSATNSEKCEKMGTAKNTVKRRGFWLPPVVGGRGCSASLVWRRENAYGKELASLQNLGLAAPKHHETKGRTCDLLRVIASSSSSSFSSSASSLLASCLLLARAA